MPPPGSDRRWVLSTILLFAVLTATVLATFRRYGIAADDPTQQAYGMLLDRFYATRGADVRCNFSWDWRYYGGLFEAPVAWLAVRSPLGVHATRALCTALAGLAGIAGCWYAALGLAGPRAAFLAALVLALIPAYRGQVFIDSKDVPFAAACAWALAGLVRLAQARPPSARLSAWTGVAIGAALGVRAGGVLYLAYLGILLAAHAALARRREAWPHARAFTVAATIAWLLMLAAWPFALLHPVGGLPRALAYFMRFPTPFPVLFNGTLELSTRLPRAYLPLLLGLTLPEPVLLLLGAGIGLAMVRMRRRGWWRDPAFLPIATTVTAAVFPVVYAVVRRTPMYNGTRHTLFILPALACLAAVSLDALLDRLAHGGHRRIRTLLVTLLAVAALRQVAFDARMFPYEYASFNTLAGGLPGAAGRYDLEYWGTSTTEASTRLAARVAEEPGTRTWRVLVCVNRNSVPEALGPRFLPAPDPVHADFLVGITAKWAECVPPRGARPLLTVSRMGVPLAFVLDLRHQEVPRGSRGRGNPVRPER